MKFTCLIPGVLAALIGVSAAADVTPISPNTPAQKVANTASDIFDVTEFRIGDYKFKLVGMDSQLNGDLNVTAILLVGYLEVGGAAGYDAAFQLTPVDGRQTVKSLKVEKDSFVITFSNFDSADQTVRFQYNSKVNVLTEQVL